MNKQELIDEIAARTKLTKVDTEKVIESFILVVQEQIKANKDITLMGFGTFMSMKRKARKGYDPHNKKEIQIPDMILPKFKPGKEFKKKLNP